MCSLIFISIVATRKLVKQFKLKKKLRGLIKKVRGGSENEILHFEEEFEGPINYHPFYIFSLSITNCQKLIKIIIKNAYYQIEFIKLMIVDC